MNERERGISLASNSCFILLLNKLRDSLEYQVINQSAGLSRISRKCKFLIDHSNSNSAREKVRTKIEITLIFL